MEEAERVQVLLALCEAGALDDERFARRFAEDKRELASWGSERIREALEARGVAREHIETALAVDDDGSQTQRGAALLAERGLPCDTESERDRALGLLARRGFPLEVAYEAVRTRERESGRDSEAA